MPKKVRVLRRILLIAAAVFLLWNAVALIGVSIAYQQVFSRADYGEYDTAYYPVHAELEAAGYPYEALSIPSGENRLAGYLYGRGNTQGLIVVSPGHRDASDIKLPEVTWFADRGWTVLCYDYTGCYESEGADMVGYPQSAADLDAVLTYVEGEARFRGLPVLLFGHSLGAYASTAVLAGGHEVRAVVAASGFDDPKEQWEYSVRRSTGIAGNLLAPYAGFLMDIKFGEKAHLSAIDGINSVDIPVLLYSGTEDEFYGDVSSIYAHRDRITNPNCDIRLMTEEGHNGHYDYFLSDAAVQYRRKLRGLEDTPVDRTLYMEHDERIMSEIDAFFQAAAE